MITLEPPPTASPRVTVQVCREDSFIGYDSGNQFSPPTIYLQGIIVDPEANESIAYPLAVTFVEDEDGGYQVQNEEMSLFGYGSTATEAIDNLIAGLADTWQGLKDAGDDELTQDALELRNRLAWYLGRTLDAESGHCS